MTRCRCGRFRRDGPIVCQTCWDRKIRSLRIRAHAAKDRAGLCVVGCWWWHDREMGSS